MSADRKFTWCQDLPGFGLQTTVTGHRSFVFQYRAGSISRRMKLDGGWFRHEAARAGKTAPAVKGTARAVARREAEAVRGAVAQGRDPLAEMRRAAAEATNTLQAVAEEYLARDGRRLRSRADRERLLRKYVFPRLGSRQVGSIRRSDVARLLDTIETNHGPVQADHVLAIIRKLFNWHAARADDFNSPIVRGMAKTKPKERQRQRVLNDDELRSVWTTAQRRGGPFGALVRFVLLTAVRRNEAARMRRAEVSGTKWTILASRHKSKRDFLIPLSAAAVAVLDSVPAIGRKGWVFTTDGERPLGGFSKAKRAFDTECGVTGWTLHDLRRSARTLMSRCGVDPDHAERALGHVVQGVRGTYDVHAFQDEKAKAFEALAAQIDRIVKPKPNVVAMRGRRNG